VVERQQLESWPTNRTTRARRRALPLGERGPLPGLRAKLLLYFVLLVLAIATVGIFAITRLVAVSSNERFDNQLREASRRAADAVARLEREHLDQLRVMALTDGVWEAYANRDATGLQATLAPLAKEAGVQVVAAVGMEGQDLLTLYRQPGTDDYAVSTGTDYSGLSLVRSALAGRADDFGDKFAEVAAFPSGAYLLTSAPVRGPDNQIVGALVVGTRLDVLLSSLKAETLADVLLLDANGKVLATTLAEPDEGYQTLELPEGDMPAAQGTVTRELSLYNRTYRAQYAPFVVRNTPVGTLGVVLPTDYVVSSLAANRNAWLVAFIAGTLLLMLVGYVLAQSIAQPVLRVRQVATAAAAGDLTHYTGLRPTDELGEVGQALDDMVERLRDTQAEAVALRREVERQQQLADESGARLLAFERGLPDLERRATLGALTAGIVQEVRDPLNAIHGLAEALAETPPDQPSLKRDLRVVRDNAARANQLIGELLKYVRAAPLDVARRDLRQTVADAVHLASPAAREAGASLNVQVPDEPVHAEYDAAQIQQVILNLLLNGLQAMETGGALTVRLRPAGEGVAVSVQDTGAGITPALMQRIFEPFFTTRPNAHGRGLGLAVSQAIVRSHSGRIDVASRPDEGSAFTVWLPLTQAPPAGQELVP
jgi:two-component system NtrC family sensor kinase